MSATNPVVVTDLETLRGVIREAVQEALATKSHSIPPPTSTQSPPTPTERLISRNETLTLLGVSPNTLRALERSGAIRAVRMGRRVAFPARELERLMAGTSASARPRYSHP